MSTRLTGEPLAGVLAKALGPIVAHPRRRPGTPEGAEEPMPVVRPTDRDGLVELLAFARAEGLGLLPLGAGTKIDATPAPAALDVLVDTSAFAGVLAFEPGDGTLTALAGTPMDELVALAASGGWSIVPRVAPGATLGGVLATAEGGSDRLQRGPVREHVLGLEVMLSDGRTSRSGGRLVKNVAGFDLHRLHLGAWGGLGLILEATLRLFPGYRTERALGLELTTLAEAVELAFELRAARIDARRVHAAAGAGSPVELLVDLAGREETVAADEETCRRILGAVRVLPPSPAEARPQLVLHALPSRAAALAEHAAGLLDLDPDARLHLDPLLARVALGPSPADATQLALPAGVHRSLPRAAPDLPAAAAPLTADLELALDPTGTFAR